VEHWVFAAARQLLLSVRLDRVEAAERAQAIRILRHLLRRPVVFGLHPLVFVFDRRSARLAQVYATDNTSARRIPTESRRATTSRALMPARWASH